jgi:thiosulfate reductase/polysulfide reductase chain A
LLAITGNIDVPGGNVFESFPPGYQPAFFFLRKEFRPPPEIEEERIGAREFPLLCGPKSPFGLYHSPTLIKAMLTGKPYPIKALFIINNILLCLPNSRDVYEAMKKLDFVVTMELFMTPTAEMSDIVLPSATWLERDEVTDIKGVIAPRVKAIEPVGECRNELEVVFDILKRMGVKFYIDGVESVEDYNNFRLKSLGITFEDLKKRVS